MRGMVQTALLLLGWSSMTRWLLAIGLVLTALGLCGLGTAAHSAAEPLFVLMAIAGAICAAISPVLMGGVVLRSLSAPRALRLIPRGRLQLLLGAALAQLALAVFISGIIAVLIATGSASHATLPARFGDLFAVTLVVSYAALTFQLLGYYLASRFAFGGVWLLTLAVWVRLISVPLQSAQLRATLSTAAGLGTVLALCALAWLAFALHYLSARHIHVPHWNNIGMGARQRSAASPPDSRPRPERHFTHHEAIRTILTGGPRQRRNLVALLIGFAFIILVTVMDRSHLPRGAGYAIVGLICMMVGPLTGSIAGVMSQRSKPLWLQSGLGRRELFAALEARSWRLVLSAAVFCALLVVGWSTLAAQPLQWSAWSVGVLVTPLASGALLTYAQLQFVRGHRVLDILLLALAMGLWMAELFSLAVGAELFVVADLLAAQILLVPVLRLLALRRWEKIDWRIHRGARNPWGLA